MDRIRFTSRLLAASLLGLTAVAFSQDDVVVATQPTPTTLDDRQFLRAAAAINLSEVQLGEVAGAKAADPSVRRFAESMITHHGRFQSELERIASAAEAPLPEAPDAQQQTLKATLTSKSGADFDRAYSRAMLVGHQEAVSLYELAAMSADPEISEYANRTLLILREHLDDAEKIDRSQQR